MPQNLNLSLGIDHAELAKAGLTPTDIEQILQWVVLGVTTVAELIQRLQAAAAALAQKIASGKDPTDEELEAQLAIIRQNQADIESA